jgi:hypothetical protein
MSGLVERWGRIGFALVSSLIWALPMAAWAGSVDLVPGPGPWVAFAIGAVLLVAWLVLLTRLGRIPVSDRPRRYDLSRMSGSERRWNAALAVFGIGLIAWLNGAATVDWSILTPSLAAGRAGSVALAVGLAGFLAVMVVGVVLSWKRAGAAYRARRAPIG